MFSRFVAPLIVGEIISGNNDFKHWQVTWQRARCKKCIIGVKVVFWISAAVYTLGAVTFVLLGSAEEQSWNRANVMPEADLTTVTKYESFASKVTKTKTSMF